MCWPPERPPATPVHPVLHQGHHLISVQADGSRCAAADLATQLGISPNLARDSAVLVEAGPLSQPGLGRRPLRDWLPIAGSRCYRGARSRRLRRRKRCALDAMAATPATPRGAGTGAGGDSKAPKAMSKDGKEVALFL